MSENIEPDGEGEQKQIDSENADTQQIMEKGEEEQEAVGNEEVKETNEEVDGEESVYNEGTMGPEEITSREKLKGEEVEGEEVTDEHVEGEEKPQKEEKKEAEKIEEEKVEEEEFKEEPPPDPAAPYNFSDSKEAIKPSFELRPDQLAEVEKLWEFYQDYTPAYTDIDSYITEKELVYMLKALLLMTYTEEQLQELIVYCVRPPHPLGHITYDQFLKMVIIRQRDLPIEEELRSALQVLDPQKTGQIEREYMREVLRKMGNKMADKPLDNLIKEVDMSNDGQIGIEDVVGTMCIDLNKEDLILLMNSIYPPEEQPEPADET